MEETAVKTHLIITDIHNEFEVKWFGRFMDIDPLYENDMPIFVLVGRNKRVELNTTDIRCVERTAKLMAEPRGREAITTDKILISIKLANRTEQLMGSVLCKKIKQFAPMYDKIGRID